MTAASLRRGLLVTGLLILAFAVTLDLMQPRSLLRRAWTQIQPQRPTPAQQTLEEIQRTRGKPIRR